MNQQDAAKNEMIRWLSHPSELGKKPATIECTAEFDYSEMKYYVFKFKKKLFDSKWLLGVCGGYEGQSLEHCGHLFSDFNEYRKESEIEDAIRIVDTIGQYWMSRAKMYENSDKPKQ